MSKGVPGRADSDERHLCRPGYERVSHAPQPTTATVVAEKELVIGITSAVFAGSGPNMACIRPDTGRRGG
jgi:hypothetical protein